MERGREGGKKNGLMHARESFGFVCHFRGACMHCIYVLPSKLIQYTRLCAVCALLFFLLWSTFNNFRNISDTNIFSRSLSSAKIHAARRKICMHIYDCVCVLFSFELAQLVLNTLCALCSCIWSGVHIACSEFLVLITYLP